MEFDNNNLHFTYLAAHSITHIQIWNWYFFHQILKS